MSAVRFMAFADRSCWVSQDAQELSRFSCMLFLSVSGFLVKHSVAQMVAQRVHRMALGDGSRDRYKKITYWRDSMDELLVDVFVEAHATPPEQIILDIDTTDVALHGNQEGRFYHGYYDHYCYLPLYIFSGVPLLCTNIRCANIDASVGSLT